MTANASPVFVPPTIEHSEWDAAEERVKLFSITKDGETTDYSMPGKPNVGLGLGFLRMARRQGMELAMSWLLEEAIGADAYDDLVGEPDLTVEDLKAITTKVRNVVLGGLEAPKGP